MPVFVFDVWLLLPLMLSALPQTAFVLLYGIPWLGAGEWWRDFVGRALFFKSLTLALLLDVLTARLLYLMTQAASVDVKWVPPEGSFDRLFVVLYWAIFASICYQLWALVRQRTSAP